jgi:hypothetical protein
LRYFSDVATGFKGECWTVSEGARERFGLNWVFGRDQPGLSSQPDSIHTGKSSGYQAIGLSYIFGASRIILLGYDCQDSGGRRHWHGDHPPGLANGGEGRYGKWAREFARLAVGLAGTQCKVLNASRRTALRCFQRVTLETALYENEKRTQVEALDQLRGPKA